MPRFRKEFLEQSWFAVVAIAALSVSIYGHILGHPFINFDDPGYISENAMVQNGLSWEGVKWAFGSFEMGIWHPLTWLLHMANVELYGLDSLGHQAVNFVLNVASAIMLWQWLKTATGHALRSLLVACLFAVHPLNVEVVAWASQLKSTLSAFFFFSALWAWSKYAISKSQRYYVLSLTSCVAGLLSKPMLVTFPIVLVLLDFWPLQRMRVGARHLLVEKIPFFFVGALSAGITLHPFGHTGIAQRPEIISFNTLVESLGNCLVYLGRWVWPRRLSIFYPPLKESHIVVTLASAAVLIAFTVWAWCRRGERPAVLVGWLLFLVLISPVSGIIWMRPHGTADRYMYLPSVGLFIGVLWLVPITSRAVLASVVVIIAVLGFVSFQQTLFWKNSLSLWAHAAAVTAPHPTVLINLGEALIAQGKYAEAEFPLEEATRLVGNLPQGHVDLALVFQKENRIDAALSAANRAVAILPTDAKAHNVLGGLLLLDAGRRAEAAIHFQSATELDPHLPEPWLNLALARVGEGRTDEAIVCVRKAVEFSPGSPRAQNNLGAFLIDIPGEENESAAHLTKAIALAPHFADPWVNFGVLRIKQGQMKEGRACFTRALELDPTSESARQNLAFSLGAAVGPASR